MAKGETPASKSVLLDYISPLQPVSIYTAIRNSHYAPALSGTLSLISALLIVVSTGLMSLDPVVLKNNQLLVPVIDSFVDQALGFNITDFDNVAYDFPLVLPYAFQHYGLDHPFGTSDTVAFQSVNTSLLPPQSLVDVVVDGFSADFDCEDAALSKHNWTETVHSAGINVVIDMHTPFAVSIVSVSQWLQVCSQSRHFLEFFKMPTVLVGMDPGVTGWCCLLENLCSIRLTMLRVTRRRMCLSQSPYRRSVRQGIPSADTN